MKGRFADWWIRNEPRFGSWASLIGLAAIVCGFALDRLASTPKEIAYAVGYMLLIVGGLSWTALTRARLGRQARYAETLPNLRQAVRLILEERRFLKRQTMDQRKAALAKVMDQVSSVFTILTGSSCRACIKMVPQSVKKMPSLEVSTFCRNTDDTEAGENHPIKHNTDFNDLYQNPSKKWFFGFNLPLMAGRAEYQNTNEKWKDRYRSTVVWPIRSPAVAPQSSPSLLGFLCVDSQRTDAFSEEFDYPVGAMITDALYQYLIDFEVSVESDAPEPVKAIRTSVPVDRLAPVDSTSPVNQEGATEKHEQ